MNYLLVGLGNVGKEYTHTRHNMGFMAMDAFAKAFGAVFRLRKHGYVAKLSQGSDSVYLLKPDTYMNLSGVAVAHWAKKLNVPPGRIVVICDDLNLPFGTLRMRKGGSAGGHNGLKDIEDMLDTQDYCRIRMGIGNDYEGGQQVNFVLGKLPAEQMEQLPALCARVVEGLDCFLHEGSDRAMNLINTVKKTPSSHGDN